MKFYWTFVLYMLVATVEAQQVITVAQKGKADYRTIQAALDAVPSGNAKPVTIRIAPGVYSEVVIVDARKSFVTLEGEDASKTIIRYNHHAGTRLPNGDTLNTWTCATVFVYASDFTARRLSFVNDAGFTAGQAVALRVEGNRAHFDQCRMIGNQDVLFLSGSGVKQYFKDCYIEGTTDFIFGAATAVFQSCHLHSKKNSHVTAASTNSIIPFGFVFFDCRLTADSSIHKVSLGRPWSPTASVTYIRCFMDRHIVPAGWHNWNQPANEKTARFAEYDCRGPGAERSARVPWARLLTDTEAASITTEKILYPWKPADQ